MIIEKYVFNRFPHLIAGVIETGYKDNTYNAWLGNKKILLCSGESIDKCRKSICLYRQCHKENMLA